MVAPSSKWSLEARLRRRLLGVSLGVGLLMVGTVAFDYGSDVTDLHQRQVLEMAEKLASAFEGAMQTSGTLDPDTVHKDGIYEKYPEAYGWALSGPDGQPMAQSAFDWSSIRRRSVAGIDEWTVQTQEGFWLAGKEFDCGGPEACRVETVVASDPAFRFYRMILTEVTVHVLIPLLPFAILSFWAVTGFVRQTLRPLREIAEQARGVSEFRDIRPLIVENPPDEVVDLVRALNGSLDRLAAAMERERAFILDASHTLRTPLAALKARLQQDGGHADLAKLRQDTDALIRLSMQLLAHANADRLSVLPGRAIDVCDLIMDIVVRMEPLARQAGVDLGCEGCDAPVMAVADPDALSIAVINLIENAIQHSAEGAPITVALLQEPLRISVIDQGAGIPEGKLKEVTKRFARGSGGRGQGAGLGLSIVEQIMRAHGGRLELRRNAGAGLTATLHFATGA
ncbi:MAG: hypothetical protein C0456_17150 [Hyphomonas sp.]|uniref:sensor histidine kinase n=1 Tax=Hyphomonas sp. TaxID=87 RepID=UPI001D5D888F|nr:ATP-binding protein [Hyphomonas sp.]MBA4228342.1 hypothetical protein [Hyphomonas sp.]